MGQNLGPLNIKDSYQSLVQVSGSGLPSGSYLTDGTGSLITAIDVTASYALVADSADVASQATSASYALTSTSASYALTSSYALNAAGATIDTGSFMITGSVSGQTLTFEKADGSTFNLEVAATGAAAESLVTASVVDATITFEKGDTSTFDITINNVISASHSDNAISASYAVNTDSATSASHADNAISASYAINATTADSATSATSASHADNASNAVTASHADIAADLMSNANININSISASNASFTSASIGYLTSVTGSATYIGDAFIVVNTDTPTQRYAGIKVVDSGSATPTDYTASLFYDSVTNDWNYEYSGSDPTNFGVVMFGPEYGTQGSPTYLTNNTIPKGDGGHHLNDSNITDDGSVVGITAELDVTGGVTASAGFVGDLVGTASFATTASYAENAITPNLQQVTDEGATTTNTISGPRIDLGGSGTNGVVNVYDTSDNEIFRATATGVQIGGLSQDYDLAQYGNTNQTGNVNVTGAVTASAGFQGDLTGTASYATNATTADSATSSSYALTASYAENTAAIDPFPYVGDASITGELSVTGSYTLLSGSFSGSLVDNITDVYGTSSVNHIITLTQAQYDAISASADPNTYYIIEDAANILDNATIDGYLRGNVEAITVVSSTASLDLLTSNFFTVSASAGANTHIVATNIPSNGQTVNIKLQQGATTGSFSFSNDFKFPSGSIFVGSQVVGAVDIVSFATFDDSTLYANFIENLI